MMQTTLNIPSRMGDVSPEEWQVRVDLAAAYRLVAAFKWDDLVFTHISARVPGSHDEFLINPYGLMFEEITASSLIKVDAVGNKLDDSAYGINPAGFTIHSAIHSARHDAQCVLHTHTLNGIAVSAQRGGVLPLSQQSMKFYNNIAYHGYEGIALDLDEREGLVADLGTHSAMILRNHGLLTVGGSVAAAFQAMYFFEAACAIQIRAQAGGTLASNDLIEVHGSIIATAAEQARGATRGGGANLVWPGLLRRLDRNDSSWRH